MCICHQNTTVFIRSILAIYYVRHNYMFRPLMLAIFRLYVDLSSSYTTYVGCFFTVWGKGLIFSFDNTTGMTHLIKSRVCLYIQEKDLIFLMLSMFCGISRLLMRVQQNSIHKLIMHFTKYNL